MYIESHVLLGYSCNSRCKHCVVQVKRSKYEESPQLNLTEAEAEELIDSVLSKGVSEIVISGGEPTLRPDLIKLVKKIISRNVLIQIQTNGINTKAIEEVVKVAGEKKRLLSFMIPLHSSISEEHDFITGNYGGFNKTIKSLEYLSNHGIPIIGKVVLTKLTGDLKGILEIFNDYYARDVIIAYPHCVSFPDDKVKEIDLKIEELSKKLALIQQLDIKPKFILQAMPYCGVNGMHNKIQEGDESYLQRKIIEYKYRDEFEYHWHEFRKKDKRKFLKCQACEHDYSCEGIWKEYLRVYGEE